MENYLSFSVSMIRFSQEFNINDETTVRSSCMAETQVNPSSVQSIEVNYLIIIYISYSGVLKRIKNNSPPTNHALLRILLHQTIFHILFKR